MSEYTIYKCHNCGEVFAPSKEIPHRCPAKRNGLSFKTLRDANVARCEDVFHKLESWSPQDWMCAAAGELGEAANLIKKMRRGEIVPESDVANEIADTVIYLDLLAARLGVDLGAAVARKFNIVSERRGSQIKLPEPPRAFPGDFKVKP